MMKVFIAGPRAISALNTDVQERLNNIYRNNYTVLVGDAYGVDKAVQTHFNNLAFSNVIVYACGGKARNNVGGWEIQNIDVPAHKRGFDYYAAKDKAMSDDADYGFMIWNGESKGTLNNIINLLKADKKSIVYLTKTESFHSIDNADDIQELIAMCGQETHSLFLKLYNAPTPSSFQQISFFNS